MTTKPDRFERLVDTLPHLFDQDDIANLTPLILRDDVVALLRKEHRAVVRMVEKELKKCREWHWTDRTMACEAILDQLKKRAT